MDEPIRFSDEHGERSITPRRIRQFCGDVTQEFLDDSVSQIRAADTMRGLWIQSQAASAIP